MRKCVRCQSIFSGDKRAETCADCAYYEGPMMPIQVPSFSNNRPCIDCGEYSASGGLRCEDCQEEHEMD